MDIVINGTKKTPQIIFCSELNAWTISGRSYPEEPLAFYEPVLKWIMVSKNKDMGNCKFQFRLEFFNTGSSRVILDILIGLKKLLETGKTRLSVEWFYNNDDDDMKEMGEMFMNLAQLPLEFVSCPAQA